MPRLLLIALLVFLGTAWTAAASAQPRALHVACAQQHGGRLRYVTSARACRRGERVVRFDAPVHACVGADRVVRRARHCARGRALMLPAAKRRVLCVDRRTRVLRDGRCRRREFTVVVLGRVVPPPVVSPVAPAAPDASTAPIVTPTPPSAATPLPVALDDEATTDEDTPVVVRVLDNDTALRVADVDTSGTVGAVSAGPDGTITYDPRGRFDRLGPTELATDSFTYRAQDVPDPVTVFVTVTGVDDAPVIGGVETAALAYDTGSDAIAVTPSLTLSDVDSRTLAGATVRVAGGYARGADALESGDAWDEATGTLTLTGEATVAQYEAALRRVAFRTGALTPSGARSIEVGVGGVEVTRGVEVHHVNLPPTAAADAYGGATGNTALAVGTSVLANDNDADDPSSSLTASAISPTPSGARVTMHPDGTFTYVPPVAFTGDDSFEYTVHDGHAGAATGTVAVHVAGPMSWYVDAAAPAGGDGRSDAPFGSPAPLSTGGTADALDGAGDRILVSASASPYTDGIVLEPSQKLLGDPQAVISTSGAPAVTLATGADVQRVELRATGAPAVYGSGVNTATIGASSTIGGIALDGGSGAITIGSPIAATGGTSVSVQNRTGGTVSFTGSVSGAGIELRNNTGATVSFTNRLTIPSFSATGGGTVTATGVGNTLSGPTLEVRNTTIGSAGLRFQNATADTVVLNATGASGGLSISGGTVGPVSLTGTSKVSLTGLHAASITGTNVHGFTLMDSTVTGGVSHAELDGGVTVTHSTVPSGVDIDNTSGTITSLAVANNTTDSIRVALGGGAALAAGYIRTNTANAITLQGTGAYGSPSSAPGSGVDIVTVGSNTLTRGITATLSRGNVAITANTSPGIAVDATGTGSSAFEVANNTVAQGIGLTTGTGTVDAEIASNVLTGSARIGVQAGAGTQLRLTGNTLATGDVQIAGDPRCLDVVTTTAARILLSTDHGFGIAGLVPDPAEATSAGEFVAAANPGTTTASATGPQFTTCELPF